MIEPTVEQMGEMVTAFWAAHDDPEDGGTERGLTAAFDILARDRCLERRGHVYHPLAKPETCPSTVDIKGVLVRCRKPADGHDAHLGRHCGWDVVW